jgi:hypothetical protein
VRAIASVNLQPGISRCEHTGSFREFVFRRIVSLRKNTPSFQSSLCLSNVCPGKLSSLHARKSFEERERKPAFSYQGLAALKARQSPA